MIKSSYCSQQLLGFFFYYIHTALRFSGPVMFLIKTMFAVWNVKKKTNFFFDIHVCSTYIIQFCVSGFICYFIIISCRHKIAVSPRSAAGVVQYFMRRVVRVWAHRSRYTCTRILYGAVDSEFSQLLSCVLLLFCYFITYSRDYRISVVTSNVLLLRHHIRGALLTRKKRGKNNNNKNNSNNIMSSNKNDIMYRYVEKKTVAARRTKEQGFSVSGNNDIKRVVRTY